MNNRVLTLCLLVAYGHVIMIATLLSYASGRTWTAAFVGAGIVLGAHAVQKVMGEFES